MVSRTTSRNQKQAESGSVQPQVSVLLKDPITSQIIYTVPTEKTQRINISVNRVILDLDDENIRIRVNGNTIEEFIRDDAKSINDTGRSYTSPDIIIGSGQQVTATTANTGTARGQTCEVTVSVTNSVGE